ncbi:MAG: hypothetical protein LBR81_01550 [Prevotellaceae bacterium]|nr:hypothetical protein [Prevotellaceae bacterium]
MKNKYTYIPTKPNALGITILNDISIDELVAYIDWRFFFSAWKLSGKYDNINSALCDCEACSTTWLQGFSETDRPKAREALSLYRDALALLKQISGQLAAKGIVGLFPAQSRNEGIVFFYQEKEIYLPTLRQQEFSRDGIYWSLCDFVSPAADYCGSFAVVVHGADDLARNFEAQNDHYNAILVKTLADRLVEAAAEWLHEKIRKQYWGYAANEKLSIADMLKARYTGIRPAVGYPSLPDQSVIFDLQPILPLSEIGIQLTKNGAMIPGASICGITIAHPEAHYFNIGKISPEQLIDYARRRRHKTPEEMLKWLNKNY